MDKERYFKLWFPLYKDEIQVLKIEQTGMSKIPIDVIQKEKKGNQNVLKLSGYIFSF